VLPDDGQTAVGDLAAVLEQELAEGSGWAGGVGRGVVSVLRIVLIDDVLVVHACKGSANRAKNQKETKFFVFFRGAAYPLQRRKVVQTERKTKLAVKKSLIRHILSRIWRIISTNGKKMYNLFSHFVDNLYLCIDKLQRKGRW
jgi:hypothetical protein